MTDYHQVGTRAELLPMCVLSVAVGTLLLRSLTNQHLAGRRLFSG